MRVWLHDRDIMCVEVTVCVLPWLAGVVLTLFLTLTALQFVINSTLPSSSYVITVQQVCILERARSFKVVDCRFVLCTAHKDISDTIAATTVNHSIVLYHNSDRVRVSGGELRSHRPHTEQEVSCTTTSAS